MKSKYYLFLLINLFIIFSGFILYTPTHFFETPMWYDVTTTVFLVISSLLILVNIIFVFLSLNDCSVISFWSLSFLLRSKKLYSSSVPDYKYFMVTEKKKEGEVEYRLYYLNSLFYLERFSYNRTFTISDINNGSLKSNIKKTIDSHHLDQIEKNKSLNDVHKFFNKWNGSLDESSHREKEIDKIL